MPWGHRDIIMLMGKEATRNTKASSMNFDVPLVDDGFHAPITQFLGKQRTSHDWPQQGQGLDLGQSSAPRFSPALMVPTIRDIVTMFVSRDASKKLGSYSIGHNGWGISNAAGDLTGCLPQSLTLEFSRSDSPDTAAILTASVEMMAQSRVDQGTPGSAGTQRYGRRFRMHSSTFSVNSISITEMLNWSYTITIDNRRGPHGSDYQHLYIEDGPVTHAFSMTFRHNQESFRDMLADGTEGPMSFVLATGTANETVTLTVVTSRLEGFETAGGDDVVTATINAEPYTLDASDHDAVAITYGSAIGALIMT